MLQALMIPTYCNVNANELKEKSVVSIPCLAIVRKYPQHEHSLFEHGQLEEWARNWRYALGMTQHTSR